MQFFYIDYMNDGKKERNIGFLRVENNGVSVGLRGVPVQCGDHCKVYAVNIYGEKVLMGDIPIKSGYGMKKLSWHPQADFAQCMSVEIPLYGTRKGLCILRENSGYITRENTPEGQDGEIGKKEIVKSSETKEAALPNADITKRSDIRSTNAVAAGDAAAVEISEDLCEEIEEDKWQQLLKLYPEVHICPDAQSILIRPRDAVILTRKYHELAANSFVLHAYYNYRQLLLFRYAKTSPKYYLGVPGVYYERERRIAQMFGFEGFENGEARMQQDADRKTYNGCFGYYMKRVEI